MAHHSDRYIPALSHDWLTPLYDPLIRWFMHEASFKYRLVIQAQVGSTDRVLDIGCGTGTLAIMVKQTYPGAKMVGIDGDKKVLEIAKAKAAKAGVELLLGQGLSYQLPYQDNSFERVLSSLMLHHLTTDNKKRTLLEVFRVLRPGGELHVVDFGPPRTLYSRFVASVAARSEQAQVNVKGLLPEMLREAGFKDAEETGHFMTIAGALAFYRGRKQSKGN